VTREPRAVREQAARQLRAWKASGSLGLNDCAHNAMQRAALRLGFNGISAACDGA
jgi:hypothetical protein